MDEVIAYGYPGPQVCLGWQLRRDILPRSMTPHAFPNWDKFYVSKEVALLAIKYLDLASDWEPREVWGWRT